MKEIKLTQGKVALVDDEDFERLNKYKWSYGSGGYAVRIVLMHHEVIPRPKDKLVDHINCNRIDNRKCNLRVATNAQNQMNRSKPVNNKSGYKGVVFYPYDKRNKPWLAQIGLGGKKRKHLGYFHTKEEAALAYNKAAKKYHKEYAHINKVKEIE